jgi:hypothetical protein
VTHSTFSVFDQRTGRFGFSEIGFEFGPRKRGHWPAGGFDWAADWASIGAMSGIAPIAATVIQTLVRCRIG